MAGSDLGLIFRHELRVLSVGFLFPIGSCGGVHSDSFRCGYFGLLSKYIMENIMKEIIEIIIEIDQDNFSRYL